MFLLPKLNVIRDRRYLDFLHTEPCIITGLRGETVEPAHIGTLGKSIKSSDDEVLPIEHRFHASGHGAGEISMFRQHLPDHILRAALRAYARGLYQEYLAGQRFKKEQESGSMSIEELIGPHINGEQP